MAELLALADAQRFVLDRARRLDDEERVALAEAPGRVLAQPAVARVALPPFPSSAMDGFALRSGDTEGAPVTLPVVARIPAGRPAPRPLPAREAMAIATGGVVPDGADAVVPLELVEESRDRSTIRVPRRVERGANVRRRGGDVEAGAVVLEAGARLGAAQIGALAAAGVAEVVCARRPRVGILVTGSELDVPGEELAPGHVYDANRLLLPAAVASEGAAPVFLGAVADDRAALARALELGFGAVDVVVTSGGASVGPHDLVREVERGLGVEEAFWGVAVKPGKPVAFGVRDRCLVFNLPGNPVSVLVTFEVLVRPAIRALLGLPDPLPAYRRGVLASTLRRNPRRDELVRARTRVGGGEVVLEPLAGQESHMIARAARADALVLVEAGEGEVAAGAAVRFLPLV